MRTARAMPPFQGRQPSLRLAASSMYGSTMDRTVILIPIIRRSPLCCRGSRPRLPSRKPRSPSCGARWMVSTTEPAPHDRCDAATLGLGPDATRCAVVRYRCGRHTTPSAVARLRRSGALLAARWQRPASKEGHPRLHSASEPSNAHRQVCLRNGMRRRAHQCVHRHHAARFLLRGGNVLRLKKGTRASTLRRSRQMPIVRSVCAMACAAVLTSACTDTTPLAPRPNLTRPITASVISPVAARSHPNSEKYRDSGFQPATGRSGSATVSTRALLDKAGTTDVEITTGTFDGSPAPGTLRMVQVKASTPSGNSAFTDNHTGLSAGATASFSYTTLPHGTSLQVQSAVDSSDGSRTDVVTLATAVHFRPDLVASRLDAAAQAPIGAAVNLQGFILERNGEVGARADCVLYVDGTAADRATGIWVDAGGMVACAMTHVFTEARTYSLELRVENVRPRDFDDANNSVSASITAVAPSGFSTYAFQAWAVTDSSWCHAVSNLTTWDGTVETWDQIYTRQGPSQYAGLNGLIPRMLDYTAPISLRGEMSTNGATVNTVDDTYPSLPWVDWQQGYCD